MNRTAAENHETTAEEYREEAEDCIRRNTGSALLVAIGAGVAIGLLVRALRPAPTPRDRVADLLEDLNDRVRDLASPIWRKASTLASTLASDGLHSAQNGEARAERFFSDTAKRVRRFFS